MKALQGHGQEMRRSSGVTSGISSGMGMYSVGRKTPVKWQTSPPRKTKVSGVVRTRPEMWAVACPGTFRICRCVLDCACVEGSQASKTRTDEALAGGQVFSRLQRTYIKATVPEVVVCLKFANLEVVAKRGFDDLAALKIRLMKWRVFFCWITW